jgi:hypothetical protein
VTLETEDALTFADALGWFVVHRGKILETVLKSGGLVIEGMDRYFDTTEDRGAFCVALGGLNWWLEEDKVTCVRIDPVSDSLFVQMVADDGTTSLLLTPRSTF